MKVERKRFLGPFANLEQRSIAKILPWLNTENSRLNFLFNSYLIQPPCIENYNKYVYKNACLFMAVTTVPLWLLCSSSHNFNAPILIQFVQNFLFSVRVDSFRSCFEQPHIKPKFPSIDDGAANTIIQCQSHDVNIRYVVLME